MLMGGSFALAVCAWYWRELFARRNAGLLFAGAAGLLALALLNDSIGPQGGALPKVEELLELGAAALIAVAAWLRWREAAGPGVRPKTARRAERRAAQASSGSSD